MEPNGGLRLNQVKTGQTGKIKEVFPALANWPDSVIEENFPRLREAYRHLKGDCGDLCDMEDGIPHVHEVLLPAEEPGSFHKEICLASKERRIKKLLTLTGISSIRLAGFPKRYLALPLERLDAKEKVMPYIENFSEHKEAGRGLLIVGPTGTGKTQLITALGVNIINRYLEPVFFIHLADFCAMFRKAINDGFVKMDLNRLISSKNLVIIDDLGAVPITDFDHANINSFIDTRYREELATIFTSNLSKKEMAEYIGERAVSRISEMCETVILRGPDRRTKV